MHEIYGGGRRRGYMWLRTYLDGLVHEVIRLDVLEEGHLTAALYLVHTWNEKCEV